MLFDFKLQHTPGITHVPDGLSRRPGVPEDPIDEGDPENWIDKAYGFAIVAINWDQTQTQRVSAFNNVTEENSYSAYGGNSSQYTVSVFSVQMGEGQEKIPHQPKAVKADALLDNIRGFFNNPIRPEDIEDHKYSKYLRQVREYLMKDQILWKKDLHGVMQAS
ncbi:hypothetical protein C8J57DRAFT_1524230 [Mycena rebaudengoi]|nr:hypothetical protein C8J57DRAFT_1524230 [Mycena rebaudengoi]